MAYGNKKEISRVKKALTVVILAMFGAFLIPIFSDVFGFGTEAQDLIDSMPIIVIALGLLGAFLVMLDF